MAFREVVRLFRLQKQQMRLKLSGSKDAERIGHRDIPKDIGLIYTKFDSRDEQYDTRIYKIQ